MGLICDFRNFKIKKKKKNFLNCPEKLGLKNSKKTEHRHVHLISATILWAVCDMSHFFSKSSRLCTTT